MAPRQIERTSLRDRATAALPGVATVTAQYFAGAELQPVPMQGRDATAIAVEDDMGIATLAGTLIDRAVGFHRRVPRISRMQLAVPNAVLRKSRVSSSGIETAFSIRMKRALR